VLSYISVKQESKKKGKKKMKKNKKESKSKVIARMFIEGNREEVVNVMKNENCFIKTANNILEVLFYYDNEKGSTFCKDFCDMLKAEKLAN
jgi:hypothetical protein